MKKKSEVTTLAKAVFGKEDDGGPAGGYTLFVSAIQGTAKIVLEVFLKWECRDAEVSKYEYMGPVEKLTDWVNQLNEFDTESVRVYLNCIEAAANACAEQYQPYVLSQSDLPDLPVLKVASKA